MAIGLMEKVEGCEPVCEGDTIIEQRSGMRLSITKIKIGNTEYACKMYAKF